ncbi:FAD-binding protein [Raoultibacter phocaeensis]|uniref:FAD-binding protein n=1 Tax=Raoultibacter phocaeensis TaxID=2479841 RepID=UPI00111A112F|nr:FAD-binding protein [Raoultibacter phocaeensis]
MSTLNNVWVIGESPESYRPLAAAAKRLGAQVHAIVVGDKDHVRSAAASGVEGVKFAAVSQGGLVEDCADAVIEAIKESAPDAVLFATSKRMRLLAARIAAALGTRVLNDVGRIWVEDDGHLAAEHMVYGGKALAVERVTGETAVALLSDGLLLNEPVSEADTAEASVVEIPASGAPSAIKLIERKPRTVESVNLAAARHVVSVGRGIEKEEDLALADELACALEAEVGCTRPIAEGANWMSRERYIGVSGAMLKPDLFVAVGLSGQIQHMVGANSAKTIIAINKDKNAPVFKQADYGIVGDLYEVVPKLTAALTA